ncbi:formylglycine-generating enzyme family protein, partial [bacterium]|nr:formylglycine-generating enzyme family protein [bacterium]
TAAHGKNQEGIPGYETTVSDTEDSVKVDAISGPTPPYGSPDQGWGKGMRPAITMTHHAAMVYCEWLSKVTGKKFRLPTEAEWEYACRAGTTGPYYFEGNPKKLTRKSWINRMFRKDTSAIDRYVWSATDSGYKTYPPFTKDANPWGLYNMLGNVMEFCLDWYAPDALDTYPGGGPVVDPAGPQTGTEHVVRGGSYNSDPADLRIANRDHTQHDRWLVTDPQSPKSIWWYSDTKEVGFRVVRVFDEEQTGMK